jgi:hypothetical protein
MDADECPICYETFDTDFLQCETCCKLLCVKCLVSLKTAVCPFCRQCFTGIDIHEFSVASSYSSSSSSASGGHDEFITPNSDWNISRINRHQNKKLYKRQEDEAQRIRNAHLSRSHNHRISSLRKAERKYPKQNLQFEIED